MAQGGTCNPYNMQIFLGRGLDVIVTQAFNLMGQTEGFVQLNCLSVLDLSSYGSEYREHFIGIDTV
jgi:hypothetical protein